MALSLGSPTACKREGWHLLRTSQSASTLGRGDAIEDPEGLEALVANGRINHGRDIFPNDAWIAPFAIADP